MIPFLLLFTLPLFAATDSINTFEKSHPRDNTYCSFKGKKVELMIRGVSKFTESRDRGYGEYLFYKFPNKKPVLLKLNEFRSDSYKLFRGTGSICSKSHGFKLDSSKIAILLQKENRPFKDKLIIQLFDARTLLPSEVIETEYLSDRVRKSDRGFTFRTISENHNPEIGRVSIDGENYIFQEKDFPQWIEYSSSGFEAVPELTFKKLPWKRYFKDQEDFFQMANWDNTLKKFGNTIVYHAVSHKLKKNCLLFIEKKQKLVGTETWRCQAI